MRRYSAESITIRRGVDHVRLRPAMYVGDVYARGYHHLAWEVVANVVDLALARRATQMDVTLHRDGSLDVADDGPGIPVDPHPRHKLSTLEVFCTVLGACGRFQAGSWKVSGGLHGVGLSTVTALSSKLEVTTRRDGRAHLQRFEKGRAVSTLRDLGPAIGTGTSITFTPDRAIFKEVEGFSHERLAKRLRDLSYLVPGFTITFDDRTRGERQEFHSRSGAADFVTALAETSVLHKPIQASTRVDDLEDGPVEVHLALTWQASETEQAVAFANLIHCTEGGAHLDGLLRGLERPLAWMQGLVNTGRPRFDQRHRQGLVAVVSVLVAEPQFEGATKTRLANPDVNTVVRELVERAVVDWATNDPWSAERLVESFG